MTRGPRKHEKPGPRDGRPGFVIARWPGPGSWTRDPSRAKDGSGLGRGSRGGRSGRGLGRNALGDHTLATAGTARTATADRSATAAAGAAALDRLAAGTAGRGGVATRTAVRGSLAAGTAGRGGRSGTVATIATAEETVALLALTMATLPLGKQPAAVAPTATVATMTGDRTGVTADERDGDEGEEHRKGKTEEPLHRKSPRGIRTRRASMSPSHMRTRSGTATGPRRTRVQPDSPHPTRPVTQPELWKERLNAGTFPAAKVRR